ncbi:hypothetical protein J6590_057450 [Homalodisca vitripennis]|nr:hypothetical protein J6590_057450 [Homalodisca vitripennis]
MSVIPPHVITKEGGTWPNLTPHSDILSIQEHRKGRLVKARLRYEVAVKRTWSRTRTVRGRLIKARLRYEVAVKRTWSKTRTVRGKLVKA